MSNETFVDYVAPQLRSGYSATGTGTMNIFTEMLYFGQTSEATKYD